MKWTLVCPSAPAQSAKLVFAKMMTDYQYPFASFHDCDPLTAALTVCRFGVERLKYLFKGYLCSGRSKGEGALIAGTDSSPVIEPTGYF